MSSIIAGALWLVIGFVEFLNKLGLDTATSTSATHYQLLALLFVAVLIGYSTALSTKSVQKFLLNSSILELLTYRSRKEGRYIVYRASFLWPPTIILLGALGIRFIPSPADILVKYVFGLPIVIRMFLMISSAYRAKSTRILRPSWHEAEWWYE